jgi:hypothetical protein
MRPLVVGLAALAPAACAGLLAVDDVGYGAAGPDASDGPSRAESQADAPPSPCAAPCLDGGCNVVTFAPTGGHPLILHENALYWGDGNAISRRVTGDPSAAPQGFANVAGPVEWFAFDGNDVYYATKASGVAGIYRSQIPYSASTTVTAANGPNHLFLDGERVYWADKDGVHRIGKGGMNKTDFDVKEEAFAVVVHQGTVYWRVDCGVQSAPADAPNIPPVPLVSDFCLASASRLVLDGDVLYATDGTYVKKIPLPAGEIVTLGPFPSSPGGLAAACDALYWTENDDPQRVAGIAGSAFVDGGVPQTLATGFASDFIAADETAIYVLDEAGNQIRRISR